MYLSIFSFDTPCFNWVSLNNCRGQNEFFASLYSIPALNGQAKCDIIDESQDAIDNFILNCSASPKIYVGGDLSIDLDADHPRDKKVSMTIWELLDFLALEDILNVKYIQDEFTGYTLFPNIINISPSWPDYLFISS